MHRDQHYTLLCRGCAIAIQGSIMEMINSLEHVASPQRSVISRCVRGFAVLLVWKCGFTGCFNAAVSTGGFRRRLPVAAKIALVIAGTMAEVPASPIPPGGSALFTMYTSIAGASFIRSMR